MRSMPPRAAASTAHTVGSVSSSKPEASSTSACAGVAPERTDAHVSSTSRARSMGARSSRRTRSEASSSWV